jgi:putative photosynthetic complex assembly protein
MRQAAIVHFPKLPLTGAIAVVIAAVLSVAAARMSGVPPEPGFSDERPARSRLLRFADQADGSILVTDAATGSEIARAAPGTNGFLRGSLRGLMRMRKISDNQLTAPFVLARWPDRHLTLEDTATNIKIDLMAYGPTNAAVFEKFMLDNEGVKR